MRLNPFVVVGAIAAALWFQQRRAEALAPIVYTVQPGDTLRSIAGDMLGSRERWAELQKLNDIVDPRQLRAGQQIILPADARNYPGTRESGA